MPSRYDMPDVRTTLDRLKVEYRDCGGGELGLRCPWCGYPDNGHPDKTCSINEETGVGKCQHSGRCSQGGFNLYQLRKQLGDPQLRHEHKVTAAPKTYRKPAPCARVDVHANAAAEYLKSRGLDLAVCKKFGVFPCERKLEFVDDDGNKRWRAVPAIAFPYLENGKCVDRKYRLHPDTGNGEWKTFQREPQSAPGLFGYDLVEITPNCRHLIVTGGELDTLAGYQLGWRNVVNGPSESDFNWIDRHWDWLQGFEFFFIATDNDDTGNRAAAEIARRLGIERCWRVPMADRCKDVLESMVKGRWTNDDAMHALARSGDFRPAKLISLADLTDAVFAPDSPSEKGDECHLPTLNRVLRGFRPGEQTLWGGDDGAGKSTVIMNIFVHWARHGIKCCMGSFELRVKRQGRWVLDMIRSDELNETQLRQRFNEMASNIWLINHIGAINTDELLTYYRFAAQRYGVRHFLTDSVTMLNIKDDDYPAQLEFARKFKQELVDEFGVHHHVIIHTRKGVSDKTAGRQKQDFRGNIQRVFDNAIMIYRDSDVQEGEIETRLAVLKSREYGGVAEIPLVFRPHTRWLSEAVTDTRSHHDAPDPDADWRTR